MSFNSFGRVLRFTTWGESHGPAIGVVVDGVPPRIELTAEMLQQDLDRRRPGTSRFVTQRKEPDKVRIDSGTFLRPNTQIPITTGTPVSMIIDNVDVRSKDYGNIADVFRPGHADYTYFTKYGVRDPRGGGRSSARETACRVAVGALARRIIPEVTVRAAVISIGKHKINRSRWDWDQVSRNSFFCPDAEMVAVWEQVIDDARKAGSSIGATIEVIAEGVPPGWGAPLYGKVDADLAAALMGINAAKAVEIGDGFDAADSVGDNSADEMFRSDNSTDTPSVLDENRKQGSDSLPVFSTNHAGGILGGITTGQPIVARVGIKPTSSVRLPRQSLDVNGNEVTVSVTGRHDPCVGIRAVPVVEAMVAFVLADQKLTHRAQCG